MKILIVGAGGIGGYFGGRLAEAGADVTFLLRPRRAALIDQNGLVIRSRYGDATIRLVRHVEKADRVYDLILVACKAYDLDDVMNSIADGVGNESTVLPLLNGMQHIDALSARFGHERVIGGHCLISAAIEADGAIAHYSELHHLTFGELDGSESLRTSRIAAEVKQAKFTWQLSTDIVQELWEKWVFIASMGCLNSLMRAPIGDVVEAGAADIAAGLYEEACEIARENGHAPRKAAVDRAMSILVAPGSTITASLFKDVEGRGRTEAEHIIGNLIARSKKAVEPRSLLRIAYANLRSYEIRRLREAW